MTRLQNFLPPDEKTQVSGNNAFHSLEFTRACEDLCRTHDMSNPYRSETNGIAEHALLVQSRFSEKWWREVMECFCHVRKHTRQIGRQKVTV